MTSSSLISPDYTSAVQVPGLEHERGQQLVAHIQHSNKALSERPPLSLAVARCAAILLASYPDRLSGPTALAQATALAHHPKVGPALIALHEGLMQMDGLSETDLASLGTHRYAFRRTLAHALQKVTAVLQMLDSGEHP